MITTQRTQRDGEAQRIHRLKISTAFILYQDIISIFKKSTAAATDMIRAPLEEKKKTTILLKFEDSATKKSEMR